jgi:hypothetical protein
MQIRKILTAFIVCALFALTFFPSPASAYGYKSYEEQLQEFCATDYSRTYVLDTQYEGKFAGKRVITLTQNQEFFVIDSNQGGTKGVPEGAQSFPDNRFTSGQGVWKCIYPDTIKASNLNFNFPAPDSEDLVKTAKVDYEIFVTDFQELTVRGNIIVSTYPLEALPESSDKAVKEYTFTFTGKKWDPLEAQVKL